MASTTRSVLTPTLTGATITASGAVASSQTCTISPTTAQSVLDFANLHIRVENQNSTTSVSLSLGVGTRWSDIGQGAKTITIATATTVVIGGQDFEGTRFLNTAGSIVFTQTGTGPTSWEAFQSPRSLE